MDIDTYTYVLYKVYMCSYTYICIIQNLNHSIYSFYNFLFKLFVYCKYII